MSHKPIRLPSFFRCKILLGLILLEVKTSPPNNSPRQKQYSLTNTLKKTTITSIVAILWFQFFSLFIIKPQPNETPNQESKNQPATDSNNPFEYYYDGEFNSGP
jgi:hypothetical protein